MMVRPEERNSNPDFTPNQIQIKMPPKFPVLFTSNSSANPEELEEN